MSQFSDGSYRIGRDRSDQAPGEERFAWVEGDRTPRPYPSPTTSQVSDWQQQVARPSSTALVAPIPRRTLSRRQTGALGPVSSIPSTPIPPIRQRSHPSSPQPRWDNQVVRHPEFHSDFRSNVYDDSLRAIASNATVLDPLNVISTQRHILPYRYVAPSSKILLDPGSELRSLISFVKNEKIRLKEAKATPSDYGISEELKSRGVLPLGLIKIREEVYEIDKFHDPDVQTAAKLRQIGYVFHNGYLTHVSTWPKDEQAFFLETHQTRIAAMLGEMRSQERPRRRRRSPDLIDSLLDFAADNRELLTAGLMIAGIPFAF